MGLLYTIAAVIELLQSGISKLFEIN
jgi:hypothetical protein